MSVSLDELKYRIEGLRSKDPAALKASSEWMEGFIRTSDAWILATQLVSEAAIPDGSPMEDPHQIVAWWGAKILYSKLKLQYFQLEENLGAGAVSSLKENLTGQFTRLAQNVDALSVHENWQRLPRYLALCISTMHIQSGLETAVSELFAFFGTILPHSPRLVLEFMLILPEECENRDIDVSPNYFYIFENQMGNAYSDALSFLHQMWESSDLDTKVRIMNAIKSWTSYAPVNIETLMGCELIPISLQNLSRRDDLFVASIDLWMELLDRVRSRSNFGVLDLPKVLLNVMPELQQAWKECMSYLESDDLDDTVVSICRHIAIFLNEFSGIYLDMIFSEDEFHQAIILPLLLECAKFPASSERDISVTVLDFFDISADIMLDPTQLKTHMIESVRPLYTELFQTAIVQMAAVDEEEFNDEDISKFEDIREHWRSTVKYCSSIIGPTNAVAIVNAFIQAERAKTDPSTIRWHFIESAIRTAGFLCHRCRCKGGSSNSSSSNSGGGGGDGSSCTCGSISGQSEGVSTLIELVLNTPKVNVLTSVTINITIGLFYPWLGCNPNPNHHFLLPALQSVLGSLSESHSCDYAAKAFDKIAQNCTSLLTANLSDFVTFYLQQKQSGFQTSVSEIAILRGIFKVLDSLTDDAQAQEALNNVLGPINQSIETLLATFATSASATSVEQVGLELNNLVCVADAAIRESVYLPTFSALLPLIQRVLEKMPCDSICQSCCKFLERSLRNSPSCFGEISPILIDFVMKGFQAFKLSPLLRLGSAIVSSSSAEARSEASLALHSQMIFEVSTTFFACFTSQNLFIEHKGVVDEYFSLLCAGLQNCPTYLLSNTGFSHILSTGLSCLQFVEDDSQRAVFLFFQCLARLAAHYQPAKDAALAIGQEIMSLGVMLLSGEIKLSAFDDVNGMEFYEEEAMEDDDANFGSGSLVDLLFEIRKSLPVEFEAWLHASLRSSSEIPRQQAERLNLMGIVRSSDKMIFLQRLEEYEFEVKKRLSS